MTNMSIQPLWLTHFIEILLVLEFQLTKFVVIGSLCIKKLRVTIKGLWFESSSWSFKMSKFIIFLYKEIENNIVNQDATKPMDIGHLAWIGPLIYTISNFEILSITKLD